MSVHSIRWRALPQMRQNGLDRLRIGDLSILKKKVIKIVNRFSCLAQKEEVSNMVGCSYVFIVSILIVVRSAY